MLSLDSKPEKAIFTFRCLSSQEILERFCFYALRLKEKVRDETMYIFHPQDPYSHDLFFVLVSVSRLLHKKW